MNGLSERFYFNGTLRTKEYYKDGKREGLSRSYDPSGTEFDFSPRYYRNGKEVLMIK
jgi:antitoxin component YwqK of YwqJK toxin-antitoxin module